MSEEVLEIEFSDGLPETEEDDVFEIDIDGDEPSETPDSEGETTEEEPVKSTKKSEPKAKEPEEEEAIDIDTFVAQLNEYTDFGLTPEDVEAAGGDLKGAIENKKYQFANDAIQGLLNNIGEEEREAAVALLKGAKLNDLVTPELKELEVTEEDLEDDVTLQRKVITENLKLKGRTEKEISRTLKGMDEDELLDEAKEALKETNSLVKAKRTEKKESAARQAEAQRKAQQEAVQAIMESTDKFFLDQTFAPVKLQKTTVEAIKASTISVINEVMGDLKTYGPRLALLKHLGVLDGKWDKVAAKAKDEAIKSFRDVLSNKPKPSGMTKRNDDDDFHLPRPRTSR